MTPNKIHDAYCQAYNKSLTAIENGDDWISIQESNQGGYRLVASWKPRANEACYRSSLGAADWAINIMYRLAYLHYFNADDLDAYFDELDRVGYH